MLERWHDAKALLEHFSPRALSEGVARIGEAPEDVDRIFDRTHADEYPSLTRIGRTYDVDTPRMLLYLHLKDYCNVEGVTEYTSEQLYSVADVIASEYGHLNVGEITLFFRRMKAGRYGHMYVLRRGRPPASAFWPASLPARSPLGAGSLSARRGCPTARCRPRGLQRPRHHLRRILPNESGRSRRRHPPES